MSLYYMPKFYEKFHVLTRDTVIQLDDLNSLSEKMIKLCHLLEIPEEEKTRRQAASVEVHEILKKYYPDCLVFVSDSFSYGFGLQNDLDLLFLPFPEYSNLDYKSRLLKKSELSPDTVSIVSEETSKDVLLKCDEWSHLKFIRTVLRQDKVHVKKCTFIPSRSPILKIHLNDSKIICDLSVSNKLIFYNTELLEFFKKLDPRVKPLAMTLRFWARSLGFLKRNFFTNHAFNALVIFFLQNVNPPVLPSVQHLIEISGFSRLISGWETAFTTDEHKLEKSKNTKTVSELLLQFFEYYWNFDFEKNVVSPNSGKPASIEDLKLTQDERMKNFEISSINIQDPLILSQNICKLDSKLEISKTVFKFALHMAREMLQRNDKFSMFLDQLEYQKKINLHYERYMFGCPKVCFINLDHEYVMKLSKSTKTLESWHERVSEAIFDVLHF